MPQLGNNGNQANIPNPFRSPSLSLNNIEENPQPNSNFQQVASGTQQGTATRSPSLPFIKIKLPQTNPLKFLIDTGFTHSFIDPKYVDSKHVVALKTPITLKTAPSRKPHTLENYFQKTQVRQL